MATDIQYQLFEMDYLHNPGLKEIADRMGFKIMTEDNYTETRLIISTKKQRARFACTYRNETYYGDLLVRTLQQHPNILRKYIQINKSLSLVNGLLVIDSEDDYISSNNASIALTVSDGQTLLQTFDILVTCGCLYQECILAIYPDDRIINRIQNEKFALVLSEKKGNTVIDIIPEKDIHPNLYKNNNVLSTSKFTKLFYNSLKDTRVYRQLLDLL